MLTDRYRINRHTVIAVGAIYVGVAALLNGEIASNGGTFTEQIVITVLTGVISAGGVILGAWLSAREGREARRIARENKALLEEHSRKLEKIASRSTRRRSEDK